MINEKEPSLEETPRVVLRAASSDDMPFIREHLEKFLLDDEAIDFRQFIVAVENGDIVGFGRIRPHREVYELGSIGVIESRRSKGIGKIIVERLLDDFPVEDVHLVTDIPAYFERLGFRKADKAPKELIEKIKRICPAKCRAETVVMSLRREKKS